MSEGGENPNKKGKWVDANDFLKKASEREEAELDKVSKHVKDIIRDSGDVETTQRGHGKHTSGYGSFRRDDINYRGTQSEGQTPGPAVIVPKSKK